MRAEAAARGGCAASRAEASAAAFCTAARRLRFCRRDERMTPKSRSARCSRAARRIERERGGRGVVVGARRATASSVWCPRHRTEVSTSSRAFDHLRAAAAELDRTPPRGDDRAPAQAGARRARAATSCSSGRWHRHRRFCHAQWPRAACQRACFSSSSKAAGSSARASQARNGQPSSHRSWPWHRPPLVHGGRARQQQRSRASAVDRRRRGRASGSSRRLARRFRS